jgi:hypothetical protein
VYTKCTQKTQKEQIMILISFLLIFINPSFAEENHNKGYLLEPDKPFLELKHGFRFGYGYTNTDIESHDILRSKWMYVIGYELNQKLYGGDWIDVLFVQNVSIVGLNQSILIPSLNALIGFEFSQKFQIVSGINIVPGSSEMLHMVLGAGWTPKVGKINIPCHVTYIPDVNNNWRMYLTTGVNW